MKAELGPTPAFAPLQSVPLFSGIRTLFCKWTPWESQMLAALSQSLTGRYAQILRAQFDAANKIQRILDWQEIDFYVMKHGRVCWDGVPCFDDTSEFLLARARTVSRSAAIVSKLTCINGHLFCIESDAAIKPVAFRPDVEVQVYEIDARYAKSPQSPDQQV